MGTETIRGTAAAPFRVKQRKWRRLHAGYRSSLVREAYEVPVWSGLLVSNAAKMYLAIRNVTEIMYYVFLPETGRSDVLKLSDGISSILIS